MELETSFETDGYDGRYKDSSWWFEAWGSGPKADWNRREEVGRPPTARELRNADYIVLGIRHKSGQVIYRTHLGGLDMDARIRRREDA